MPDTSGHDATRREDLHSITLRELEAKISEAGIVMSRRQIMRHCKAGTFDAQKLPAANNVEEWFIAPASVDKGIADIRTLQALRARRDATGRDMSDQDQVKTGPNADTDMSRHDAARRDVTALADQHENAPVQVDMSRRGTTDLDIFDHPYVKRLEDRIDKLETKYEAQVRRTEEIQIKSQEQLIELQRLTAVGQSQTLADFMLKARDWVFGNAIAEGKGEVVRPENL